MIPSSVKAEVLLSCTSVSQESKCKFWNVYDSEPDGCQDELQAEIIVTSKLQNTRQSQDQFQPYKYA